MSNKFRPLPDIKILLENFNYDPESGILIRNFPNKKRPVIYKSGYNTARINGFRYNISRICWKIATGNDPGNMEIDHIDRDPFNNKFNNLRLSTRSQQLANRTRTSSTNLSKGVTYHKNRNRYYACWGENGNKINVGGFLTEEEARLFYLWNTRHHKEFADELPISACPPHPRVSSRNRRRKNTQDLPKGVSYIKRKRKNGEIYIGGYMTSFRNKNNVDVCKKGFKTADEAHQYYLENRK